MYEIWLALNIVYEIALGLWPWLLALLLVWLGMLWLRRRSLLAAPLLRLLAVAGVAAGITGVLLPLLTRSGFGNFGYWVDWANWLAMAAGLGVATALWLWPWLSPRRAA